MKYLHVNDYDMAYLDVGAGPLLVCVHGTLGDFRVWSPLLGLLSRKHRVIALSLRRYFPERWDGVGAGFTIGQHVADLVAFIESLGAGAVDLLGHSRGGHLAFRLAQQRPDLIRKLVLAEPGGDLDASLAGAVASGSVPQPTGARVAAAAAKVQAGDIDGGLASFVDGIDGPGTWQQRSENSKQMRRDNAHTLLGQINEARQPYTRADAESIRLPTLLIGGENTKGSLANNLRALAAHIPGVRVAMIPQATHMMYEQDPVRFSSAVLDFIDNQVPPVNRV